MLRESRAYARYILMAALMLLSDPRTISLLLGASVIRDAVDLEASRRHSTQCNMDARTLREVGT